MRVAVLFTLILGTSNTWAQSGQAEVRAVIDRLFVGMRTSDSAIVSRSVLPGAILQTITEGTDGMIKTEISSVAGLVKAIGTPHEAVWDEQIYDVVVQVDGPMATVWAPYKFFRGTEFSHCGVNAFSLIGTSTGWKIAAITDTRRKENCL